MFKKILSLALAAVIAVSVLASCGGSKEPVAADVPIDQLAQAVRDAYGDMYPAGQPIDAEFLDSMFGIKPEWCAEYVAEMAMMMTNVDYMFIIKPTEGNEENVLNAVKSYQDYMVNDAMKYPKDIQKVNAAQIFTEGGYVFYFLLGFLPDEVVMMEGTEEEINKAQYDAALANNQKAIDAVNALFFPEGK